MKRSSLILLTVSGLLVITVLLLSAFSTEEEKDSIFFYRWFWFLVQDRPPSLNDGDEKWITRYRLNCVEWAFSSLSQGSRKVDRDSFRKVKDLEDLWAPFQKRHMVPPSTDEGYLDYNVDGWGRPFRLEVTQTKESTKVRISSKNGTYYRWVELVVGDQGHSVTTGP